MANNTDIELLAGLDISTSEQRLIKEIQSLQKRLEASGNDKIKLNIEIADTVLKSLKDMEGKSKNFGNVLANNLIGQFKVIDKEAQNAIRNISSSLYKINLSEIKTGKENPDFIQTLEQLGNVIVSNSNMIKSRMGIYDEFYAHLKAIGKIKISDSIISDLGDDWKELRQVYPSKFVTNKNGIELDSVYSEFSDKFKDIFSGTANPTEQFRELTTAIKNYRSDVDKLVPIDPEKVIGFDDTVFETVIQNVGRMSQQIREKLNKPLNIEESAGNISKESVAMEKVEESATSAAKAKEKFADANREVAESADNTAEAVGRERNAMDDLDGIDTILANINMHGRQGDSVFQQFGLTLRNAFVTFTAANLLEEAIYRVIDAGKESVETVKELNDAAVSLRMATGDSYASVKNLIYQYNELGQELGAITTDVSDSADEWLRQGHNINETTELIKDSMILSRISNLDSAASTKYLTSAMQGYKVTVGDVRDIVDKLSAVDLESATDAGGLAEAMSRTAESANIAGISMDNLLGMIATVGEVTQKSMSSIGESYKTIFSRMRDIKDNRLSVVGDDGEIEDLSNVEIVLDSLGIKLRESNQEFRNFQDVLNDVAGSWNTYSSVQKAAIAKAFSGVRQQENFLVMMENWDKVIEYTDVASDSAGTAEEKFGYYLESLEAKTNSLKASLEKLAAQTISDELYASVLDITKAIVDMTAQTGILKSALIGIGTSGSIYAFQQLAGFLHDVTQEFANLDEALSISQAGNVEAGRLQDLIDLTGGLSQSQTRLILSTGNLSDAQMVAVLTNQGLNEAEALQQIQTWGLATAQSQATTATITWDSALRGLWSTLLANPLVLVTTAVTAGAVAFNLYQKSQNELMRATQGAAQSYSDASDTIEKYAAQYKKLYEELSSANTTEERQKEIKSQLLTLQDELNSKYADESDKLDLVTGAYKEQTAAILEFNKAQAQRYLNENESGIKQAEKKMTSEKVYNLGVGIGMYSESGSAIMDIAKEFEEQGIIVNKDEASGTFRINIKANATDANNTINNFMSAVQNLKDKYGEDDTFLSNLLESSSRALNFSQETIDQYGTQYEQALKAEIAVNDALSASYNQAVLAVQEYNNAITSGDAESIKAAEIALDDIKFKIDITSPEWEKYGNIINAVFDKAASKADAFKQSMDNLDVSESGAASKTAMISSINSLSEGMEKIDKIYKDILDKEEFDYSNLADEKFTEIFGGLGTSYENFIETISKSPSDIDATQSAFNNLVSEWIESKGVLNQVTEETKGLTTAMLENMGIANADQYVGYYVAINQMKQEIADFQTEVQNFGKADTGSFIEDLKSQIADFGKIGSDSLKQIEQNFPSMKSALENFNKGLISSQDLVEILESAYLNDADAFWRAQLAKLGNNEEFYKSVIGGLNPLIDNLAKGYDIDLQNYKTMEEAKAAITSQLINQLSTNWGNYFGTVVELVENTQTGLSELKYEIPDGEYDSDIIAMEQAVAKANKLKLALQNAAKVEFSLGGFSYTGGKDSQKEKSSTEKEKKNFSETIDWIETDIERCNEKIDLLQKKLDDLPTHLQKNPATDNIIDQTRQKIEKLHDAYDRYMEEANKTDLLPSYIDKIQNGMIDIETITDEALKNEIETYKQWYDKAQNVNDEIEESIDLIKELNLQKLDNITNDFDNLTSLMERLTDYRDALIQLKDRTGEGILESDYTDLIGDQMGIYDANQKAYEKLLAEFENADIEKYSDDWFKYTEQLVEYQSAMADATDRVEDFKDAIVDLRLKPLEQYSNWVDSVTGSNQTLSDLIGDDGLLNGSVVSDKGLAKLALLGKQLELSKQNAEEYSNAIKSVTAMYENGTITLDEYNERIYELRDAQESAVLATKEARDAILQFRYDAIQAQIDDFAELTQARIKDLEQMRENEKYADEIAQKQKNITNLEKKIAMLSQSTDRADQAMKLKLEQELAEARKDLSETQADHELETVTEKLEEENEAYREAKENEIEETKNSLEKQDEVIKQYLAKVKDNYSIVYDTLNQYGSEYNLEATEDLTSPWVDAESAMDTFTSAVSDAIAQINIDISSIDLSKFNDLSDMLGDLSADVGGNGGSSSLNFNKGGNDWKWQKGQGGKWWYGQEYSEDGNYDYASGGIYTIDGKQYNFDDEGYMKTGWDDSDGNWRYFETDKNGGEMVKSAWRKHSDGNWYYLKADGTMAADEAVKSRDGSGYYYLDSNGVWDGATLTKKQVDELGYSIAYRNGTHYATKGFHLMDEEGVGSEAILTDKGVIREFKGGEIVFDPEMKQTLWDFANDPAKFYGGIAGIKFAQKLPTLSRDKSGESYTVQKMDVNFNVDGASVEELRREFKKYATGDMWGDIRNKAKMYGR